MTGDHFVLSRSEDGKFYWELWGSHHPRGPIAKGSRSYQSRTSAEKAMKSAHSAMVSALDADGELRIDDQSR